MTEPSKIPVPFAEAGTKNEIPQTTDERGRASWGTGFPAETSIPVTEGGVAPKRADFNGLFHALSAAEQWEQQGNLWSYDNSVDYQPNAIVTYNGEIYLCAAANGPSSAVKSPLETAFWTALTSGGRLNTAALAQGTANISISGSSASAVADGEGNTISDTYMPKSGGNFTGDVTVMGESILTQAGGTVFGNLEVKGTTTARSFTSGTIVDETGVTNEVTMSLDNAVTDGTSSGVDDSVFRVSVKGHDFKFDSKTAETVFEITPKMGAYLNGVKMATLSSNVASATKLADARKINGVRFDGTTDITVSDDTKLPLSGGTMTGAISLNGGGNAIKNTVNTGNVTVYGGTNWNNSAWLNLNGGDKSSDAGTFSLVAASSDGTAKVLKGTPDGTLSWGGKNIITTDGGAFDSPIKFKNSGQIRTSGSTGTYALSLFGIPDNFQSSMLTLQASGSNDPQFSLKAGDGTTSKALIGKPNGTLTWMGLSLNSIFLLTDIEATVSTGVRKGTISYTTPTGYTAIPINARTSGWSGGPYILRFNNAGATIWCSHESPSTSGSYSVSCDVLFIRNFD